MGNMQIRDFFSHENNLTKDQNYLLNYFNSETLNHGQFLSDKWISLSIEKQKENYSFFDWNNVQTSALSNDQIEEKVRLQQFKENLLIGNLPVDSNKDFLNPTLYDETQVSFSPSSVIQFKDHQNQKFLVINQLFNLILDKKKKEFSALGSIKNFFNQSNIPKAAEVGIRSGIHLMIALLREISKNNSVLRDDTLSFLIELFAEIKPLSLWGTSKIDIILDKSLHTVADFLEELVLSEETSIDGKTKAIKVLFSLGLLSGSLANLLAVVHLLRKIDFQIDLGHEIRLLKNEKSNTSFNFEKNLKNCSKIFFKSVVSVDTKAPEKTPNISFTTDGKYIYLHSEIEGLLKIGSGYGYTMFGKVYIHKNEYRLKEKSSLVCIQNRLFYRSAKITPLPLIELNIDTLEEIEAPIYYDSLTPNCLFAENTNPEIEFPHSKALDSQETSHLLNTNSKEHAKKAPRSTTRVEQAKKDIRLMRPASRTPAFTEGRYLYIISQWTVDNRGRNNDSDDEEEGLQRDSFQNEFKMAKFGVDIYDPLNDFEHMRSVELIDPKNSNLGKDSKTKPKPPLNSKILEFSSFATNGSEIVVNIPSMYDEIVDIQYKYFDLKTGNLTNVTLSKEGTPYVLSYDYKNNIVFGVSSNKKTIEFLTSFVNLTIPEKFQYKEDSKFHQPYENEKIVEISLEGIGLSSEEDKNTEKLEKIKEDWQILLNLGFTNKDGGGNFGFFKSEGIIQNKEETQKNLQSIQLFLLSSIARLADSYANLQKSHLNINDEKFYIDNFRKPYCVNLLPKVFKYLEGFLDEYSNAFFEDKNNENGVYDVCSFLCILRLIKVNLANLEHFKDSMSLMSVELPSVNFCKKYTKIIKRIFKTTPCEIDEYEDIRITIYREALSIFRYNLSFIYPSMNKILKVLLKNLGNSSKNLISRDKSVEILNYLKEERHIKTLVGELMNEKNLSAEEISKSISNLTNFINSSEITYFCNFVCKIDNDLKIPTYKEESIFESYMSFLIELQKEILFQVGQKTNEKSMEMHPVILVISNLTESITKHAILVNESFENCVKPISKNIEKRIREEEAINKLNVGNVKGNEKKMGVRKKKKEVKTPEQKILDANMLFWDKLTEIFTSKVYFSQILSMQINMLCLLASNFLISAKILKNVTNYLNSLNKLYVCRKDLHSANVDKINILFKEKSEVFETEHPCPQKTTKKDKIYIPGAKSLKVVFDPKCDLKRNCDYLQFFYDEKLANKITERMDNSGSDTHWPKENLFIEGDTFWYNFYSDNCKNSNWGYKFVVYASIQDNQESDWFGTCHRSVCWLSSKCAAQLVNGAALQLAFFDEEQKYSSLLNSKLFSGGIEKCYFSGGKEAIWMQLADIINEFEAGHLSEYLTSEMTEIERELEEILNHIILGDSHKKIQIFLNYLQKQFARECLWANLGGEKADKLVRSAFAVIVKHAGQTFDFYDLAMNFEKENLNPESQAAIKKFVKKWQSASKMRTWLVEKRKDIDDMAERSRQIQVSSTAVSASVAAAKKKEEEAKYFYSKEEEYKHSKRKGKWGEDEEEKKMDLKGIDLINLPENQQEDQKNLLVRDTEEVIQKMIDQIIKKSQFLIQLIPAQHWSFDMIEKGGGDKHLLFRASSEITQLENKEEEWKRRLLQWKSVRQAEGIYKSLEDESQSIHQSLTTSVLSCLQSPVSIKRLRKQVESAYLRAICRTIGLNALTHIIISTPGSLFRQDVIGWLCSSLRGSENKLYHFTDNLQGCGYYLEGAVNTAFKNVIVAVVKSMSNSNDSEEIKCMLEALKWKYHGDDHTILAEINLFSILKGLDEKSLLRRSWGKRFDHDLNENFSILKQMHDENFVDGNLVKKLLELFEIIVILCVGRLEDTKQQNLSAIDSIKRENKSISLEKHVSTVDEYSAEILIRQAFEVIFNECKTADMNYRKFKGLDWGAWMRACARKERQEEEQNKRKKQKNSKKVVDNYNRLLGMQDFDDYAEWENFGDFDDREVVMDLSSNQNVDEDRKSQSDDEEEDEEEIYIQKIKEKEEEKTELVFEEEEKVIEQEEEEEEEDYEDEEYEPQIGELWDIKKAKPMNRKIPTKEEKAAAKKDNKGKNLANEKNLKKKIKEIIEKEEREMNQTLLNLYNPEFLFKLLMLIFKCSSISLDQVSIVIGNPKYIGIMFSLLQSAPPMHKVILVHIFSIQLKTLPSEIFSDSLQNSLIPFPPEIKVSSQEGVLYYFYYLFKRIHEKCFSENIVYPEDFPLACEIIDLFRELLTLKPWAQEVTQFVSKKLSDKGPEQKISHTFALSVLGGQINGLRVGGYIQISTRNDELFEDNVLLKENLGEEYETATIMGFSNDYREKISDEEKKKLKEKEDPRFNVEMNIGGFKENKNPVVLIHSTIAKEITSLSAIEMSVINRFNCSAVDQINFIPESFQINDSLLDIFSNVLKDCKVTESKSSYLKSLALKSVNRYLTSKQNVNFLLEKHSNLIKSLMDLACKKVITQNNLMNMEMTEERLFRLLKSSAETGLNLSDLKNLSITVNNNELEVLLGKDFSNVKFPIQSGYNLSKIDQFYEAVDFEMVKDEKNIREIILNKVLIISAQNLKSQFMLPLLQLPKFVITHDFDMKALSAAIEENKFEDKKTGNKDDKEQKIKLKNEKKENVSKKFAKLIPKIIVNVSEKYLRNLLTLLKEQESKEEKDIYCDKILSEELTEFGFPKDIVDEYLLENSKSSLDIMINDVAKLVEIRFEEEEKQNIYRKNKKNQEEKEIAEKNEKLEGEGHHTEEEEVEVEEEEDMKFDLNLGGGGVSAKKEETEKEDPNICFKCRGEKELQILFDEKNTTYDSCVEFDLVNSVGKVILFKQTNFNLAIYYARRAILSVLEFWPEDKINFIIENSEMSLNFLKLISFEGIFSSSTLQNNILLNRVCKLLAKYLDDNVLSKNKMICSFIDKIFEECVIKPIKELENKYLGDGAKSKKKKNLSKDKTEPEDNVNYFTGRLNNESEINLPFLDFSLKIAELFIKSKNPEVYKKIIRFDLLFSFLGLITVIRQNKSLGWGLMIFSMKFIDFLKKNHDLNKDEKINLFQNSNVKKLHEFLHSCKNREKSDAHSRRTQIVTELMIFLNKLQRSIDKNYEDLVAKLGESGIDLEKFKMIENLTDVVEMMENYQHNKTLIASTWLDVSSDLVKKEEKVIDGDHFYYKNLHSYKVTLPFTSETTIKFSEDSQSDIGDSILFSSDPKGEHSLQKYSGTLGKKEGIFPSGTFYVHFPAKGSDIYSFGQNDNAQLAAGEITGNGPYSLEQFSSANVINLDCGDSHVMILTKSGELYGCGSGSQTGISSGSTKILTKVNTKDKVNLVACGSNFTVFSTENNELYGIGSNTEGRCGLNYNNGTSTAQLADFPKNKIIRHIACGLNHSLVVTAEGHLYAAGANEHGQLGLVDENGNKFGQQNTFKSNVDFYKWRVIHCAAGNYVSLIIVAEKNNKTSVWTCGEKNNGKLGLGPDISNNVTQFAAIQELKDAGVNNIFLKKKHCIALTNTGKAYAWGNNEFGQLGVGSVENIFKPKLITFFEKMRVLHAAVGNNHTIFLASYKNEENINAYAAGENNNNKLCLRSTKEKVQIPHIIEFFQEKNPMKVISGANSTFLLTENMRIPKFRDTHKETCNLCKKNPIFGAILINPQNQETFCFECVNSQPIKSQPEILIFSKENHAGKELKLPKIDPKISYLTDFESPEKRIFPTTKCSSCGISPITDVLLLSVHEKDKSDYSCQNCALLIKENQVSITFYYRILRPLNLSLPIVSRLHFFNHSETYGYHMTFTPKFSEKGHDYMITKYSQSYENFSHEFKNMLPETDEQLVDLINNIAQKKEKKVVDLDENLVFPKDELNIRSALEKCSNEFLRKRFLILKNFNNRVNCVLKFIDFSAKKNQKRMRNIYSNSSVYIFWDVKTDLFEKILAIDVKPSSNTRIKVNRMKASKFIQKGKPDHTAEYTVFGQLYQYFKNAGYGMFKVAKDDNPFSVQFIGEASIDIGGPYREAISQICTELQSTALPLVIPSPNQKNDTGQFREKWVLNPGSNTLIHMKMFEFLGAIMGCSIRTRNFLNLDLPSIIWKQLVDSPLNRKDLENIDRYTIQCLDDVINIHKKGIDENNFNDLIQEKFVTYLSNGSEVELFPGGKSEMVTFERRVEYCALVEEVRLNEFKRQAEAVRIGLTLVIPEGLLNLLTWRELETLVCGKPILDVDLLRQNTIYRGCSESDPVVDYFWKALTEFSPDERSMYLRFVFGRSRLPLTSKDFPMKHQVEILRKTGIEPDIMLPIAHTCFFSIELPRYTSYEILRDKLKYAITHCQAIDTDGRAYDIWDED